MKIRFTDWRSLEGEQWGPGEHEIPEPLASRVLETFRGVTSLAEVEEHVEAEIIFDPSVVYAKDVEAWLNLAPSAEAVQQALDLEKAGKGRSSVISMLEDRLR